MERIRQPFTGIRVKKALETLAKMGYKPTRARGHTRPELHAIITILCNRIDHERPDHPLTAASRIASALARTKYHYPSKAQKKPELGELFTRCPLCPWPLEAVPCCRLADQSADQPGPAGDVRTGQDGDPNHGSQNYLPDNDSVAMTTDTTGMHAV